MHLLREELMRGGCGEATAITRAEALRPQVALLDIGLPVVDGYDLARRLHHC